MLSSPFFAVTLFASIIAAAADFQLSYFLRCFLFFCCRFATTAIISLHDAIVAADDALI